VLKPWTHDIAKGRRRWFHRHDWNELDSKEVTVKMKVPEGKIRYGEKGPWMPLVSRAVIGSRMLKCRTCGGVRQEIMPRVFSTEGDNEMDDD